MTTMIRPADVDVSALLEFFRPPRWTFAGVCRWCGECGCDSPLCAVGYGASWWSACGTCYGNFDYLGCVCDGGVAEYGSRRVAEVQARRFLRVVGPVAAARLLAAAAAGVVDRAA